jgi:hypoxanthine phosphoribosyltransferase
MDAKAAQKILDNADRIRHRENVDRAIDDLAETLNYTGAAKHDPVLMPVMSGALYFVGQLLPRLHFPLQVDFCSVQRYKGQVSPEELAELDVLPNTYSGRTIIILDDILDEGITIQTVVKALKRDNVGKIYTVVMCTKPYEKRKYSPPNLIVGFEVPDRYVFGAGMDIGGYWRNLPDIWALSAEDEQALKSAS